MPRGPRERIKARLDQAIGAVEKVQGYIIENGEENREYHPEITSQYEAAYAFAEELKNLLIAFRSTY